MIGYGGEGVASASDTMTLLANTSIPDNTIQFGSNNNYNGSNLHNNVKDIEEERLPSYPPEEKEAVITRTLNAGTYDGENTDCIAGGEVTDALM